MAEETDVELRVTNWEHNRKHGITWVRGSFDLRFAHGVYVEESFVLLQRLLHEAMEQFNAEAARGHAVLDDGTTVEWLNADEVRSER
jgi:hypothetical protein